MKIENWPLDKIIPYEKNAKLHNDEAIKASIRDFKPDQPIVVDGEGVIIKGHGRLAAAKSLGMKTFPVIVRTDLTPDQVRAARIADNSCNKAGWDMELLECEVAALPDFDFGQYGLDLSEIGSAPSDTEGKTDPDDVPEVPKKPKSETGKIYRCGKHRVMCGDSACGTDLSRLMGGKKADMVFADPPYGVSYASKNEFLNAQDEGNRIQTKIENDHMGFDDTKKFILAAFTRIKENLAYRSSYYITAPQGGDLLMMMMMMMRESGLTLRHMLVWCKNNHVLGRTDYNYKHEPILYGWVDVHDFYGEGEHRFSTWDINKPNKNDLHPTMKPVELVVNCFKNSTKAEQIGMDPFLGSGTTVIAAEKTGRVCYGMEISPQYVDVIRKRWAEFVYGKDCDWEASTPEVEK